MNFIYHKEDGEQEVVLCERWAWGVIYNDDSILEQFDFATGIFHRIGEVDQSKVRRFILRNISTQQMIDLIVPNGAKLIHKYRYYVLNHGTEQETKIKLYMFGYLHEGKHFINFVLPNDCVIQTEREDILLNDLIITRLSPTEQVQENSEKTA